MNLTNYKEFPVKLVKNNCLEVLHYNDFPARVAHINRQGLLVSVSKEFHKWLNLLPGVVVGSYLESVITPRNGILLKESIDRAIDGENSFLDLYYPENTDNLYKICVTPCEIGCLVLVLDTNLVPVFENDNLDYLSPWLQGKKVAVRKIFNLSLNNKDSEAELSLVLIKLNQLNELSNAFGYSFVEELFAKCLDRINGIIFTQLGDMVQRISYDQVLLIITDPYWLENIKALLLCIKDEFSKTFMVGKKSISLSANFGISRSKINKVKPEAVFKKAELALFCAGEKGVNRHCFYNKVLQESADRQFNIQHTMQQDLASGSGFYMVYQPIVDLTSKSTVSVEALVRWNHKELGELYPDEFISIAESCGQIIALGEFVIKESLKGLKLIQKTKPNFKMSINVSPIQLKERHFSGFLKRQMHKYSIMPESLVVEITESYLLDNSMALQANLKAICALGCQLSMDDFGTGYSSFTSLKKHSFSFLKIDKTFIADITVNKQHSSLVKSIVAMSADMQLKVIVEGIEHKDVEHFTQSLNCEFGQGYLFSKPLLIDSLLKESLQC